MKKVNRNPRGDPGINCLHDATTDLPNTLNEAQAKIEIFGKEMIEKRVKASANSGRIYLPPDWVGHKVKIIRVE